MAFSRDTVIDFGKDKDQVKVGIAKLDHDLSKIFNDVNSLQTTLTAAIVSKVSAADKGVASGFCPLDSDVLVPIANLGSRGYPPTGQIIMWPLASPPAGYFECDGSAKSSVTYPALYAVIGTAFGGSTVGGVPYFKVPDYRGEFLRGWDHGRGIDASRGINTFQSGANQTHNHLIDPPYTNTGGESSDHSHYVPGTSSTAEYNGNHQHLVTGQAGSTQGGPSFTSAVVFGGVADGAQTGIAGNHTHQVNTPGVQSAGRSTGHIHAVDIAAFWSNADGSEARPRNFSVMFCIKYL